MGEDVGASVGSALQNLGGGATGLMSSLAQGLKNAATMQAPEASL